MIGMLGHYWANKANHPLQKATPTKPTRGPKELQPLAEARQILTRFRDMAVAQDITNTAGNAYFMQTPIAEGYQAIMFIEFLGASSIVNDIIPRDLRVAVHPYIIPISMQQGRATGLESLLHAAAASILGSNHQAVVQFEQRRNELTKAFGLMIAMGQDTWDHASRRQLTDFSNDMVSNPMMTVLGPGVQGSYLTPQSFINLVKQDLRRVIGQGSPLVTGISNAISEAIRVTNSATDVWKREVAKGFREKVGLSNRQSEQIFWKASAGVVGSYGCERITGV